MIKAVKKDTGSLVYMKLKKHPCPECGRKMKVVKMKKTVKSNTKEAANLDFSAAGVRLGEKVKFIWLEFKCPDCEIQFTEEALRKIEKKAKKDAAVAKKAKKKAARAEEKAEKREERAAKKAEKRLACEESLENGDTEEAGK